MALHFAPAVRNEAKARVAIIGPTGAGKTWTALEWATALGNRIAVIDTENGSAALYSDTYEFVTATWLPPYSATKLAAAIKEAAGEYDVVIVDSLTHFWQGQGGVLDIVDAAASKARGNTYAGWKEGTPVWRGLLDALIFAPCHIIVTMRSKMDYVQNVVDGRTKIEKVGMAPVARNDVEYEFTVVGDMDQAHKMTITKSRCSLLADEVAMAHQSGRLAGVLRDWLRSADPPPSRATTDEQAPAPSPDVASRAQVTKLHATFNDAGIKDKPDKIAYCTRITGRPITSSAEMTTAECSAVIDALTQYIANSDPAEREAS